MVQERSHNKSCNIIASDDNNVKWLHKTSILSHEVLEMILGNTFGINIEIK